MLSNDSPRFAFVFQCSKSMKMSTHILSTRVICPETVGIEFDYKMRKNSCPVEVASHTGNAFQNYMQNWFIYDIVKLFIFRI